MNNRIALGAAALALLHASTAAARSAKLLAFVQTSIKQRALQQLLQDALPSLSVTTVGRVADFGRALAEGQDALLTLPIVMSSRGIVPQVLGRRGGSSEEPYSLVGANGPPALASLRTVGAIDMLDRAGTNALVQNLVGKAVKVERVTKVEDLLPLLQLSRADAVLLPSRLFWDLKATSSLHLEQRELPTRLGLPALASVGPNGAEVVAQASKLTGKAAWLLGVDSWS
ncbi:MAG TPA: hypothetical protein VJN18_25435 [Polyangiaceae bacterium]|nr:hypothetical protein [Polyangiaceae bacterium]